MGELDLAKLSEDMFQGIQIDKEGLVDAILSGNIEETLEIFWDAVKHTISNPITHLRTYLVIFFAIGIGTAILKQLNHLFENAQIQKTSFWIIYLIMAKQLLVLFYSAYNIAEASLETLLRFGKVFVPTFTAALTLASGRLTGAGYVAVLTFIIYIIEQFLLYIILPVTEGYMLLSVLGGIWQRERVEQILHLFEKGISIGLKGTFVIITGIGVLQSMILPFVDQAKVGAAKKIVNLIPGIGNVSATTLEMITGSAILLKNGIGVIGIFLLLIVCAAPLIKVGLICIAMKLVTIIYGLMDEKELTWCVDKMTISQGFMLKIIGSGLALFLVWILLAVYTTNQRLWS